ncbi:GntR family transcriptional regulator [Nocardioides sp.]|uniref:GntR family transcriptional regulator n=1 Tax=Nocardioides sp. TaxID=35761 RepID=UPI002721D5F5|nr:GntR family transcriptional regulator [Nocardioides sp.]MDO9456936.1 GntR family transcriptional regulator [Nocardioides sp.]
MTIHPLDADSATPLYEQLRAQVASRAATGDLPAGTRLPTVRQLALDLGIGVRTVQRVYTELESDGVVVTEGRRGTSIAATTVPGDATEMAEEYAATARRLGLTLPEAVRLLERSWSVGSVGADGAVGGDQ